MPGGISECYKQGPFAELVWTISTKAAYVVYVLHPQMLQETGELRTKGAIEYLLGAMYGACTVGPGMYGDLQVQYPTEAASPQNVDGGARFAIPWIEEAPTIEEDPGATPTGQYKTAVLSDVATRVRSAIYNMDWNAPDVAAILTALSIVADRIPTTYEPALLINEALQAGFQAVEDDPNIRSSGDWHYSLPALVLIASIIAHRVQSCGPAYQTAMLAGLTKEFAWLVYNVES